MSSRVLAIVAVLAAAGVGVSGLTGSGATFTHEAVNPSNGTSAPDFVAPSSSGSVIAKATGGTPGYLKQGGAYYVYANVTDSGNPASGIASVTADVSSLTSGQTAVALTAGTYAVGGASYNYRSASLTASSPLAAGTKSYTLALADNASNSRTASGYSAVVDNTAPSASDLQTTNSGTANRPSAGDTLVLTTSEALDPSSLLSGWDGASRSVSVRIVDAGKNDVVEVYDGATKLNLGVIDTRGDFLGGGGSYMAFNSSTAVVSGTTVTITLGGTETPVGGASWKAAPGGKAMEWTPVSTITDRAGNAIPITTRTEACSGGGCPDADF